MVMCSLIDETVVLAYSVRHLSRTTGVMSVSMASGHRYGYDYKFSVTGLLVTQKVEVSGIV